jgi:hypothetical protein
MLTREDVRRLCGELSDWKIAKIIASQPTYGELETAVVWAQGEDLGTDHQPLEGKVAYLYEIIIAGEEWEDDPERA